MKKLIPLALLCLLLSGCGEKTESGAIFAMNTLMDFGVTDTDPYGVLGEINSTVKALENRLSRTIDDSELSRLSQAGGAPTKLSEELAGLVATALEVGQHTGGAFDVTIAPAASAWGFTESAYRVPTEEELSELRQVVDAGAVKLEGSTITLLPGQQLDLGGIAKGYATDCIADVFLKHNTKSAYAFLGGNVLAWGTKADGTPWHIGVKDPQNPTGLCAAISLTNAYAVTSGGYERCFTEGGKTYHHILDPETLYPAESDLLSVTIIMEHDGGQLEGKTGSGTLCDALSTALFVLGEEEAAAFWRSGVYDFEMILVTADGRVVSTPGVAMETVEGSGYTYETIA